MNTTTTISNWLKQQVSKPKQPIMMTIVVGKKKQHLLNQLYEGTGHD